MTTQLPVLRSSCLGCPCSGKCQPSRGLGAACPCLGACSAACPRRGLGSLVDQAEGALDSSRTNWPLLALGAVALFFLVRFLLSGKRWNRERRQHRRRGLETAAKRRYELDMARLAQRYGD